MTSIRNLPEETLYLILGNLPDQDLKQCQQVCRCFYAPAHNLLLREVVFNKFASIEKFIRSIDANPDPSYLKAVRVIHFRFADLEKTEEQPQEFPGPRRNLSARYPFSNETIRKLFFRFPNLAKVLIYRPGGMFEDFNDEICQEFLNFCPKLDVFEIQSISHRGNIVYKLRLLLTRVNLSYLLRTGGDPVQTISQFPRVREVDGVNDQIKSLTQWLQILHKLPNLTLPSSLYLSRDDGINFAENYLATLTPHEQTILKQQLSKNKFLSLTYHQGYNKNVADFAAKFLTHVKFLTLSVVLQPDWDDIRLRTFCHEGLDFIAATKFYGGVTFQQMNADQIKIYCPIIMDTVFSDPAVERRVLEIEVATKGDDVETRNKMELEVLKRFHGKRKVCVRITDPLDLRGVTNCLFGGDEEIVPRDDINAVILLFTHREEYKLQTSTNMYLSLLQAMPSVNTVTLDVPRIFEKKTITTDDEEADDENTLIEDITTGIVCPKVKELTIQAANNTHLQPLLNTLANTFPNLKKLFLKNFTGNWNPDKREYQVSLPNYTLQDFTLDITTVKDRLRKDKMDRQTEEDQVTTTEKFLIEVTNSVNNQRRRFVITLDVESSTFALISVLGPNVVETFEDLVCVRVIVGDVLLFKLFLSTDRLNFQHTYLHETDSRTKSTLLLLFVNN